METRQLEYLVAVAEELNFTRAARRLFVVQSTLSAGIRALEAELGTALFDRSTRRVELTPAGADLLDDARAAIDAVDRLRSRAADSSAGLRGRVRVGVISSLDVVDLPRLLGEFHDRHPLVDLVLRVSDSGSTGLADDLRRGRLDIALLGLPETELTGLHAIVIARSDFVALVPSGHRLADRPGSEPLVPRDLDGELFVDTPPGFGNRVVVDRAFDAAGVVRRVATETIDLGAIPRFVAAGLGIAVVPRLTLTPRPGVIELPMIADGFSWLLTAAARRAPSSDGPGRRSPAVEAFVALLEEQRGSRWPLDAHP